MFYAIKTWAFTGPLKDSQRLFKPIAELMCFYALFTVVLNLNPHLILAPYFNSKAFFVPATLNFGCVHSSLNPGSMSLTLHL